MKRRTRKFRDILHCKLQNPDYALDFLNVAFAAYYKDRDIKTLLICVRHLAAAHGMQNLAEQTGRSRASLYKSLSENGDPKFTTILNLLDALGYKIGHLEPYKKAS